MATSLDSTGEDLTEEEFALESFLIVEVCVCLRTSKPMRHAFNEVVPGNLRND